VSRAAASGLQLELEVAANLKRLASDSELELDSEAGSLAALVTTQ
jgi:hypothetical protein